MVVHQILLNGVEILEEVFEEFARLKFKKTFQFKIIWSCGSPYNKWKPEIGISNMVLRLA